MTTKDFVDSLYRNRKWREAHEYIIDTDVKSIYPEPEKFWTKENPHISKGENNMNNIKWKVISVNIDEQPYTVPEISVELEAQFGSSIGYGPITPDNVVKDIESKLNSNDKLYISTGRRQGKNTIREVFNTLNDRQKNAVYAIIGEAIEGNDRPEIKDVIFNDPATIVFWTDGTKTVVKCQEGDEFDPEKGLTMAIVKKVYGNKGSYCNEIKKWCEPYYEKQAEIENQKINEALDALAETAKKILGSVPTIKLNIESKKSDSQ